MTLSTSDVVSYWKADTNGSFPDAHGSNDGTISGATYNATGKINGCYDFDGLNDVITVDDADDLSFGDGTDDSAFSITCWVNMTDAIKVGIVDKTVADDSSEEYAFITTTGNDLSIGLFDSTTANRISVRTNNGFLAALEGTWIMLTATYDGSGSSDGLKLYHNDSELTTITSNAGTYVAMEAGAGDLLIGKKLSYATNYFDGSIDEVCIWNVELTSTQVGELYNSGDGLQYPFGAAPTGTNMQINIGDVWKDVAAVKINIGDTWKDVSAIKQNIGDTWKEVF